MPEQHDYDAVVLGAGFAGMYALRRLRDELGLRVRVYERGKDVGGTWYWNRYPGARCDVPSMFYSYSFDEALEQDWEWTELYPAQPEILRYAQHVADRFDLREDIRFGTTARTAEFDERSHGWIVTTDDGVQTSCRWLITAVGCLSASRIPPLPGIDDFAGETLHTGRWPHQGVDFSGRRVAVIGTGSSGIQAIPAIAAQAEHLTVFQRTPNYSLPARNRLLGKDEVAEIKSEYRRLRAENRVAPAGVPVVPPIGSALKVDPDTAREEMTRRWRLGGTSFMSTFSDSSVNLEANRVPAQFVRDRIRELVHDPVTAEKLTPHDHAIGAKRICLDTDYFVTYNRDDVTLVDIRQAPIDRITATGVRAGGVEHEVETIVFATGYDAMTGPLNALDLRGTGGQRLRDQWSEGPRTYLGIAATGFPNLFMLTGPGSPSVLVNMFVSIEQHVDWVIDLLVHARDNSVTRIEAEPEQVEQWLDEVNERATRSLLSTGASWYVGANIPGKPRVFMPYVGGMRSYRETCDRIAAEGYPGFTLTHEGDTSAAATEQAARA